MAGFNIYPPIVETYMPAFDKDTTECRVYFSLSNYQNIADILQQYVHVTIVDQLTNNSVLRKDLYPSSIKITNFEIDLTKISNDRYYIVISKEDLQDNVFKTDRYYKVQLRFTSADIAHHNGVLETLEEALIGHKGIDKWLNDNLQYFSEWSTVCLLKAITKPVVNMFKLEENDMIIWTSTTVVVNGNIHFASDEKEHLKSYQIKLYRENNLIFDTDILYPNVYSNIDEFNYTFKIEFLEGVQYSLDFSYTSTNLYTETKNYKFRIDATQGVAPNISAIATYDEENSRVRLHVVRNDFIGNLIIRRADNDSNFTIWEDVYIINCREADGRAEYDWFDYTIESGKWYKYSIQQGIYDGKVVQRTPSILATINYRIATDSVMTHKTAETAEKTEIMGIFDHIFLTAGGRQLKIKYNPAISSFKHTISESKIDTIGSKYPFIRRNGNMDYREFPISGLITLLSDEDEIFITKDELLKYGTDLYDEYKSQQNITNYNDFIYEKLFRDKVIEFLYSADVKLFRSATEGNILVTLMGISLTPQTQLGRYIYAFSCTAYEVADNTIDEYKKHNIQSFGVYDIDENTAPPIGTQTIISTYSSLGQINTYHGTIGGNTNVISLIAQEEKTRINAAHDIVINYFTYLKIEFNNSPYFIKIINNIPQKTNSPDATAFLGYLIYINNNPIVVNEDGIYELESNEEINIKNLTFATLSDVTIDYIANVSEVVYDQPATTILRNSTRSIHRIVNLYTLPNYQFDYNIQQNTIIKNQIDNSNTEYQGIIAIDIDADYGTVIELTLQDVNGEHIDEYIVGRTERLVINQPDVVIKDFCFKGVKYFDYDINLLTQENNKWFYNNQDIKIFQRDMRGILQEIINTTSIDLINGDYAIQTIDFTIATVTITYEAGVSIE